MCTCLESHWNPSQDDPARIGTDPNQELCSAEHGPAPHQELFSLELENNEHLAKARARNRLAQRRHRQKIKSLSNASIKQNQAELGGVQKRPRAQSIGMHQIMGGDSSETIKDYDPALKNGGSHICSNIPSNTHASQDSALQVVEPRSIDLGSWTPSEDIEALINSSASASTTSSLDRDKNTRGVSANNSVAVFGSPFSTMDSGKLGESSRDTTQRPQPAHSEYTYDFEALEPVSLGHGSNALSIYNNEHASGLSKRALENGERMKGEDGEKGF
ncbi:hypothetical protein VE03_00259 [Pseudogymnoascus sp. 23342-1-I1]|nr:hypothetical protein VE03_00259 [Pseudogymnoascus sp. 23342-1-I1]